MPSPPFPAMAKPNSNNDQAKRRLTSRERRIAKPTKYQNQRRINQPATSGDINAALATATETGNKIQRNKQTRQACPITRCSPRSQNSGTADAIKVPLKLANEKDSNRIDKALRSKQKISPPQWTVGLGDGFNITSAAEAAFVEVAELLTIAVGIFALAC